MKLWGDDTIKGFEHKRVDTSRGSIIRHNSFYLPENGGLRDNYLHTIENRQLAAYYRKGCGD